MDHKDTGSYFAAIADKQSQFLSADPIAFLTGAVMAGAFVAGATILSLSVGAHMGPEGRGLVMGLVFGISIILVTFAGGELFNGQVMFSTFALLKGRLRPAQALKLVVAALLGNLVGSVLLCALFAAGGGGQIFGSSPLLHDMVHAKIGSSATALLARGALCNWLACLGIWAAARLKTETPKMIVLAWCVMAYVACGFEHSIADISTLSLGLLAPKPIGDLASASWTIGLVSLGNAVGGGVMVACGYAIYVRGEQAVAVEAVLQPQQAQMQAPLNPVPILQNQILRRFAGAGPN